MEQSLGDEDDSLCLEMVLELEKELENNKSEIGNDRPGIEYADQCSDPKDSNPINRAVGKVQKDSKCNVSDTKVPLSSFKMASPSGNPMVEISVPGQDPIHFVDPFTIQDFLPVSN